MPLRTARRHVRLCASLRATMPGGCQPTTAKKRREGGHDQADDVRPRRDGAGRAAAAGAGTAAGVTDTKIKIARSAPFGGPASVYGQLSTAQSDCFKMINEQGGINGRKINLVALATVRRSRSKW
jgi:ABC-type branched-subunit amino acid transport system substrate-binding protein